MRLLEDLLLEEDLEKIDRVLSSQDYRFDLLSKAAELDPSIDFVYSDFRNLNFCNADLRGFDFTGSDLRNCVINERTIIDETTILNDCKITWIKVESLPIVVKMQEIEAAIDSKSRQDLLSQLVTDFGTTSHVTSFMVAAASKSKSIDAFLDFSLFIPRNISEEQIRLLQRNGQLLFKRKMNATKHRTRRDKTSIFAADRLIDKIKGSKDSLASLIYENILKVVLAKQDEKITQMSTIDSRDFQEAIQNIGKDQ